jgi:hypothetical protein
VGNMDVHSHFFSREEKEAERSFPKDCWCHASVPCYYCPEF